MWNEQTLARQAARSAPRQRYRSDLTDAEWDFIAPLLPKPAQQGRHRVTDLRDVLNAIRYLVRSGCEWRLLPTQFSPWPAVYPQTQRWLKVHCFQAIVSDLRSILRAAQGRAGLDYPRYLDTRQPRGL